MGPALGYSSECKAADRLQSVSRRGPIFEAGRCISQELLSGVRRSPQQETEQGLFDSF